MHMRLSVRSVGLAFLAAVAVVIGGCGQPKGGDAKAKDKPTEVAQKKGHDHSGWWCAEHGVPEEMCSACSDKVAKELKAKGDWCDKHDRAMSQCFICDPKAKEKFAAMYRAKYGKEPPPIEDEKKEDPKEKKQGTS